MRVQSLQIKGFRSFVETPQIELDAINVLIGANNSGKSSVLRALYLLQLGSADPFADVRDLGKGGQVSIYLVDIQGVAGMASLANAGNGKDRKSVV